MMHRYKGRDNHHHHHLWCRINGYRSHASTDIRWPWMRYQVLWEPVPASLLGWARPSSPLLLFSLCLWVFSSTAILPSDNLTSTALPTKRSSQRKRLLKVSLQMDRFLVTIMGLVIPWGFTLALVDGYSVLVKCPIRHQGILLIIVLGDWVLSVLTLAAACSTASVVDLLLRVDGSYCPPKICSRYLISAIMAFLSWFLSVASFLFNLWLLPSL